ncbi:MAG: cyclodeaminase/cyclohydrolase family protein [Syntrophobacterales bacterium]|jgi:formiminotetrahydrofolate cyclodeaminase|nr:cyclodeaminase/cyclohydrolase family protein [Syntrophobacterales bacterium]
MESAFLKALARARPDPGGGAAAAHGAALGVALLGKVVRLEARRPRTAEGPGFFWEALLEQVQRVAETLALLQEEDIRAYFHLSRARKSGVPGELAAALEAAVACPLHIMEQAREGLLWLAQAGSRCRLHLLSDLLVACELLGAAFRGAHHIARANLPLLPAGSGRAHWTRELAQALAAAEDTYLKVRDELQGREPCL